MSHEEKEKINDMYQQEGICIVQYCHNPVSKDSACEEHQYKYGMAYMLKIRDMSKLQMEEL